MNSTPTFPMIPLRRQSAHGSMLPNTVTIQDTIQKATDIIQKIQKILKKQSILEEEREMCDYQIGYYAEMLNNKDDNPFETPYEDERREYFMTPRHYNDLTTRYNVYNRWEKAIEDEKFKLGDISAEFDILGTQKYELEKELRRCMNRLEAEGIHLVQVPQ